MTTRSFELIDGKSDKFWTITLDQGQYTVQFGRRGTAGQAQTKEIGSLDAARQACDKLIAEKLKKGYKEVGAPLNGAASAPVAPRAVTAPPKPAVADPPPAAPPPPPVTKSPIQLEPWDWMIATWRPRRPARKPDPAPFDRKAALAVFERWGVRASKEGWWGEGWSRMELPASMSREEARFWLHALLRLMQTMNREGPSPGQHRDELAALDLTHELPLAVDEMMRNGRPCALLLVPLLNLYSMSEAVETIVETSCRSNWLDFGEDCLRSRVLQYLSEEDLQLLRRAIARRLPEQSCSPVKTAGLHYPASSYIFRLAALVGAGPELTKVVESWPGVNYHTFVRSQTPQDIVFGLPSAELVSQHMRRLKYRLTTPFHIRAWLAHTELRQLETIRDSIIETTNSKEAAEMTEAFGKAVAAPEAAPVMLSLALESKAPQASRAWLMAHPLETIAGLSAVAAGKGKAAETAIDVLQDLDRAGHASLLESQLPAELFQKVAAYRNAGTKADECPVLDAATTPAGLAAAFLEAARIRTKLPEWATPELMPPIVTAAGRLNGDQTNIVLRALANSVLPVPHPLLLALLSYATPRSLDDFAWMLFQRWLEVGAPAKEKWALGAVGLYGGDESAMSLANYIRVWPGQGKHQTAVLGLECLRAIGTDTALIQISGISQRVQFQAIKARAKECMEEIAADLGLTRPQLEDRVVPDCGLDEHGSRIFDFGPRQFRLILGPGLKPLVVDADNQRKPDLPKPNNKDDAAKAEEALTAWKLVKKQLAEAVKIQTRRLEQALVTQRRWTIDEFERVFLRHPFMMNLAQWLVWGAFRGGKLAMTFRVTEDRSLSDEHDKPVTLPAGCAIGLVHPMQLDSVALAAWGELLSDYEILPPFPQLGRPVLRLTEAELAADALQRHSGIEIPAASLVGTLERLGWQRGEVADAGMYDWHGKHFSELGFSAILEHESIVIGMLTESEDTPINTCYFTLGERVRIGWGSRAQRIPLKEIDPLILSEVLSDLQTLASKGSK